MQTNTKTERPGAERKRPDRKPKKLAPARKAGPQTAQQTIPYREIFKDGICRVNERLYTKSMEYEDINYQLAQARQSGLEAAQSARKEAPARQTER